jgi:hypothetical protein
MKKLKTLDEWKMLGKTMKLIHQKYLDELLPLLNGLPKQYWNNEWIKIDHHYNKLKSDLEGLFAKEYPDEFDTHIFYREKEEED